MKGLLLVLLFLRVIKLSVQKVLTHSKGFLAKKKLIIIATLVATIPSDLWNSLIRIVFSQRCS